MLWKSAALITIAISLTPLVLSGQGAAADAQRQVLATDERRIEALRRGDIASRRQIYADDYTLVTPAGVIHTKADQINDLASGQLRYEKFEVLSEQYVSMTTSSSSCRERSPSLCGPASRLGATFARPGSTSSLGRSGA